MEHTERMDRSRLTIDFCGYDKTELAGGPMVWLQRLLPAIALQGFNVRLRLFSWSDAEQGVLFQQFTKHGIPVFFQSMKDTQTNVRSLIDNVSQDPPDIFVANHVTPALFASRWIRAAGIPTLAVLHSDDAFYRGVQDVFVCGAERDSVSLVSCVSSEIERQLIARGVPSDRRARIPYGIPLPEETAQFDGNSLRLCYVGRLAEEQKRISEVVRAMCRIVRSQRGTSAVIYGDGPDRQSVEQLLADEAAGLDVRLAGDLPNSMVQSTLARECHVFVLLSDYEGLPIAMLEAMAAGLVPVCLDIRSGIPELIQHEVTGLLVENRVEAFDAAIRRLCSDPSLCRTLSANARRLVEAGYAEQQSNNLWAEQFRALASSATTRKTIRVPTRLNLPAAHPGLSCEDWRLPEDSLINRLRSARAKLVSKFRRLL